jgi:DNA uptake protein ComE-like DNA-binding protein
MFWKDFLYFTSAQRNGIRVLLVLILLVVSMPPLYRRMRPLPPADFSPYMPLVEALKEQQRGDAGRESGTALPASGEARTGTGASAGSRGEPVLTPSPFDPNELSAEEWEGMGLPGYVGRSIRNYLSAGGRFRYREDLKRIYLMEEDWYHQLEPFISLPRRPGSGKPGRAGDGTADGMARDAGAREGVTPDREDGAGPEGKPKAAERETRRSPAPEKQLQIDINRADTALLQTIRGIGPTFSRRITAYRDLLGGYLGLDQLLEVYGLDSARWEQVRDHILIDTTAIRRINLNECSFAELLRHPYIDRNLAGALTALVRQHGPLSGVSEIRRSHLVDETTYRRIAPYLSVY